MIRQAKLGDEKEISRIVIDSWKTAYKGIIDDSYLEKLDYKEKEEKQRKHIEEQKQRGTYIYVYEGDISNEILGFGILGKPRETEPKNFDMEIYALYVDPNNKYKGIGTEIVKFLKNKVISLGGKSIFLWCLKDNLAARRFYEKMGGIIIAEKDLVVGEQTIKDVAFGYDLSINNGERYKFLGASYLMLKNHNKILLQRRYNTGYADGLYTFLSGHIEENESFISAAKRETFEEAGVIVDENNIELFTVMQRKAEIGTYIDFFCVAEKWEKEPYIKEKDKCDEIIWCDIDKLPDNTISYVKTAVYNYLNDTNYNIIDEIT